MKISHSIFISFFFILLLFSITTFINFRLSKAVTENAEFFSRSTNIMKNSSRFQRNILTMMSGLRGYLLVGEKSFIESYDTANMENDAILQELSSLLTDSSQSQLLQEIKRLNDQWTQEYTDPLKQAKAFSAISASNLDSFNHVYREKFASGDEKEIQLKLQEKFKAFASAEYALRDRRQEALAVSVLRTRRLSFILTGISIITAFLVIGFLIRRISRRIGKMTRMANEIAGGNYDVQITDTGRDELSSLGSSLNHMAEELSRNMSLLKRSNEELDQFAHIVSHDLKSPLRGIGNVISWIEEDHKEDLTTEVDDYLQLIKGRTVRAENLIGGLLSYARANKEACIREDIDLNALVQEVLDSMENKRQVRVSVAPLPRIRAERILLYQIFSNLIGNAIKYNDKAEGVVNIYYKPRPAGFEFFVEDNGMGISESYYDRIFVIFQTLQDRDSFESTGVGLAIVKKILDSKKQQIKLSSEPGKGSVFSFTWPNDQHEAN